MVVLPVPRLPQQKQPPAGETAGGDIIEVLDPEPGLFRQIHMRVSRANGRVTRYGAGGSLGVDLG